MRFRWSAEAPSVGSVRVRPETGLLFMDFKYVGRRLREQTAMTDTPANRKRLQKALDRIETEIAIGAFDYAKTFGKELPSGSGNDVSINASPARSFESIPAPALAATPPFSEFANQWFNESEIQWRRSYRITQRGALDKYLIPHFGPKRVGDVVKADVLAFRAQIAKAPARGANTTLSNRRINAVMKPLRQLLNEAADRFNIPSPFRNIKPLKVKRSDVQPFNLDQVQQILARARPDYRPYFTTRFFTGLRTGEVHGLKWKYVDFENRLILVRESIVLGEEDELKTEDSQRDVRMTQVVYEALKQQHARRHMSSPYVFCNQAGKPLDNKNFNNRVWAPLLRNLGLAHRRPYQMRHTAATLWLASGEAPEWIARQLGHTTTEMLFRVYSRFVPNLTRQDGSAIDRLLTHSFAGRLPQARVPLLPVDVASVDHDSPTDPSGNAAPQPPPGPAAHADFDDEAWPTLSA
jgi:integrase